MILTLLLNEANVGNNVKYAPIVVSGNGTNERNLLFKTAVHFRGRVVISSLFVVPLPQCKLDWQ